MSCNPWKICFITCVNNEKYEEEEKKYLKHLYVPKGYEIETCFIKDARSMAAGYNIGMKQSDAKYKVYLHQDVFIVHRYFIRDILSIFQKSEIGMIGMVGSQKLPENAIMWDGPRIGKLYANIIYKSIESVLGEVKGSWENVEAIDGFLMATQYDLPWREDLFTEWDFYDISQSMEFIRRGYQVVVPNQTQAWCIHDNGFYNLKNYFRNRKKFKKEYMT